MVDHTDLLESLIEKATDYGKTSYDLAKLRTIDKTSELLSSLLSNAVVLIVFLLFVLFLNFGLAIWFGKLLGEIYLGFFAVGGFYFITGFLVYFFLRKRIKRFVSNAFINQVLK